MTLGDYKYGELLSWTSVTGLSDLPLRSSLSAPLVGTFQMIAQSH